MTGGMALLLVTIVLLLIATAMTGWVATDAFARERRWIRWGVVTSFFGLFALIAWLVVRRRSPIVRERLGLRPAAVVYAAAFCLVLLDAAGSLIGRTFVHQVARVEGQAMASTIPDQIVSSSRSGRSAARAPRRDRHASAPAEARSVVREARHRRGGRRAARKRRPRSSTTSLRTSPTWRRTIAATDWGPVVPEGYHIRHG